jgi:hypothetical protein
MSALLVQRPGKSMSDDIDPEDPEEEVVIQEIPKYIALTKFALVRTRTCRSNYILTPTVVSQNVCFSINY